MHTFMLHITRANGTTAQRTGVYTDGVAAAQIARATFPDAVSIKAETFASWAASQEPKQEAPQHDTGRLPAGGFYFAPGAVEEPLKPSPHWWVAKDRFGRTVQQLCMLLVVVGFIGGLAGYVQGGGWAL